MNNTVKIKAFTLAELLVVMIIAGIIILSIMEGFALIHRITFNKQNQIIENMDIYDAYYHLESVIGNSDSVVTDDNGNLTFYNDSNYHSVIYKENSCLIMNFAGTNDTVLKNISELRLIKKEQTYLSDTVAIDISYQDTSTVCWKFTVPVSAEKIFELTMEEKEKDYIYE
jgi:prepilin-type N-terminal cleavage/methylation domain-containing protein